MNREHKIKYFIGENKHLFPNSPGNRGIESTAERLEKLGFKSLDEEKRMTELIKHIDYVISLCQNIHRGNIQ